MSKSTVSPITTERLVLRAPHVEDAVALTSLMSPEVSRWLASWPPAIDLAEATRRIAEARAEVHEGDALHWIIQERESALAVGWTRITRTGRDHARGELGFWLGTAYHGHGYATEAVRAALLAGFDLLDLGVIEGGAQPTNEGSLRVMDRVGMARTDERLVWAPARQRHELCVYYEIGRDQLWRGLRGKS